MRGMLTHRFSAASDDDLAVWHSFHLEFAAAPALCELSLTSYRENDDKAGADLGFFAYTYRPRRHATRGADRLGREGLGRSS